MNTRIFLSFLVAICALDCIGQNIGYFIDRFDDLYVFEDGFIMKAEHQPVTNINIGRDFLFYQNTIGDFILYKDGDKEKLSPNYPNLFITKRNSIVTDMFGGLAALGKKEFKSLTLRTELPYSINDSIIAYEEYDSYLNVYYKFEKKEIAGPDIYNFNTSGNTLSYIDADQTLFLNYNFENFEVERNLPVDITFKQAYKENLKRFGNFWVNATSEQSINNDNFGYWVGNKMVAYINDYDEFILYKDGEHSTLSEYVPLAVFPGYNVIAYITEDEEFYIYEDGNNQMISAGSIKNIAVLDNIVIWTDNNQDFYCWHNGEQIKLENYIPSKINVDLNNVVYTDLDNNLKAYYQGEKVNISQRQIIDYNVFGNVIVYKYNVDDFSVYWNGNRYNRN